LSFAFRAPQDFSPHVDLVPDVHFYSFVLMLLAAITGTSVYTMAKTRGCAGGQAMSLLWKVFYT
jgi:hypothetical protein